MQGAGLHVTVVNNGREGVDAAMKNQYDVILMDIQMPVMDGYTATRTIREWESVSANADADVWGTEDSGQRTDDREQKADDPTPTANIPIIAMTAHAMAGDEQKSLEAGMNGHVTKPIDPEQLFATLQKWIKPLAERTAVPKSLPVSGGPPALDVATESNQQVSDEAALPESLVGI